MTETFEELISDFIRGIEHLGDIARTLREEPGTKLHLECTQHGDFAATITAKDKSGPAVIGLGRSPSEAIGMAIESWKELK